MTDPIRDWAQEYSETIGSLPKSHHPAAQRARLLFAFRGRNKKSSFLQNYFGLAAGALAFVGALVWWIGTPTYPNPSKRTAEVPVLDSKELTIGQPIIAKDEAKTLSFPSGTRALFTRSSSGTVSKVSEDTVELTLEEGSLQMDVAQRAGLTWVVRSGKFRVYVVGTAFSVSREAASDQFQVQVKRGKVRVEGPDLGGQKILLGAGEKFGWAPTETARFDAIRVKEPQEVDAATAREVSRDASPSSKSRLDSGSSPGAKASLHANPAPDWQTLARAGKYERALEEVEKRGAERVLASSSADDRLLLGNAARYVGRIDLGSRAYLAARESGGAAAPLAAYYLAKIALDSNGDQSGAIRWLETYLREAPSGDLAASARARLMTLLNASGKRKDAERVAREYLTLHPTGPNAKTAKALLLEP